MSAPASNSTRPAETALPIRTKEKTPANVVKTRRLKPRSRASKAAQAVVVAPSTAGQIAKIPAPAGEKKGVASKKTTSRKAATAEKTAVEAVKEREGAPTWKLSPFLGGRYAPLDSVFTRDEKNILLAQALALKVYSTKTSLLVRVITVPAVAGIADSSADHIVSYFLDPRTDDRVYITTTTRLYLYSLTSGEKVSQWNMYLGGTQQQACICTDQQLGPNEVEAVFVTTKNSVPSLFSVWRVGLLAGGKSTEKLELYRSRFPITSLQVTDNGRAVCIISGTHVVVINLNGMEWMTPRVYKMSSPLTCMDIQPDLSKKGKKGVARRGDIAVGDSHGAIYVLPDVIKSSPVEYDHTPRKLHWHRMAVSSVKWALDGTYIISGGSETVLVIWQLATGLKQFLPHLGATIKNIVVSPQGSAYAVGLSDNSIMVLSTSELKPKANIAGIQSHAQIRWNRESRAIPCLLHPTKANNLLIATPSNQLDQSASAPYLQTFDTYSDRHISRQALARTNATIMSHSPDNAVVSEPDITFLAATSDGQWMASVDEWLPSKRNALGDDSDLNLHTGRKREVFLKFWRWSEPRKEWELITRVDAPHPSPEELGAESILDLAAAPNGQTFATVGTDGCAKIWKPKMRVRPGATAAESAVTWGFRKSINFAKRRADPTDILPLDALTLAAADDSDDVTPPQPAAWGNVAFSDDSSVLAASCPDPASRSDSLLHLIDPATGTIRQTLGGLLVGRTTGLAIVDRFLIVAGSMKLLAWNLVHARAEWEYTIHELAHGPTRLHLAVDHTDSSIAVAFSNSSRRRISSSTVLVWKPVGDANPVFATNLDAPVAALKTAPGRAGFVVLDIRARVQYVAPVMAAHASVATIVASGQEVEEGGEEQGRLAGLYAAAVREEGEGDVEMEEGVERVVARERLEEVFDACAEGPVEVAFERVLGLFAMRPVGVEEEEEEERESEEEEESAEESD